MTFLLDVWCPGHRETALDRNPHLLTWGKASSSVQPSCRHLELWCRGLGLSAPHPGECPDGGHPALQRFLAVPPPPASFSTVTRSPPTSFPSLGSGHWFQAFPSCSVVLRNTARPASLVSHIYSLSAFSSVNKICICVSKCLFLMRLQESV